MLTVTLTRDEAGLLHAYRVCADTATVYRAEFTDSTAGAVGLSRFCAMLRMTTGQPVEIESETEVTDESIRAVIAGAHPPVRYDGRYKEELGGAAADGA